MNIELFTLITNLGALTVAGILYAAYIRNLGSQLSLKDEHLNIAEQNVKLWKDKALELERQTPQFIEQLLGERIRIREEELARLSKDSEDRRADIDRKNSELEHLKVELETAQEFGRGISVYDPKIKDYHQIPPSKLTLKELGAVWVDTATLMICDPYHLWLPRDREIEDYPPLNSRFRDTETGEEFCVYDDSEKYLVDGLSREYSVKKLVEIGRFEELSPPQKLPAIPDSYIKSENFPSGYPGKTKTCTFYNGAPFAGLKIGTRGDGMYTVRAETYEGEILRIMIDL